MSLDPHPFKGSGGARGNQPFAFNFDQAQTAGTIDTKLGVVTERRNLHMGFTSQAEDIGFPFPGDRAIVYIDDFLGIHGSLLLGYSFELTSRYAGIAFDADHGIDPVHLFHFTADGSYRADSLAESATPAGLRIDGNGRESFTTAGGAVASPNVGQIFIPEKPHRAQHRIGS